MNSSKFFSVRMNLIWFNYFDRYKHVLFKKKDHVSNYILNNCWTMYLLRMFWIKEIFETILSCHNCFTCSPACNACWVLFQWSIVWPHLFQLLSHTTWRLLVFFRWNSHLCIRSRLVFVLSPRPFAIIIHKKDRFKKCQVETKKQKNKKTKNKRKVLDFCWTYSY